MNDKPQQNQFLDRITNLHNTYTCDGSEEKLQNDIRPWKTFCGLCIQFLECPVFKVVFQSVHVLHFKICAITPFNI